ncbi:hypothetical protein JAAARDRAFT_118719 [Jaapia argillacea MUCL 33604]|uniref:NADP-dependent oxidoreductase domain-containing protein n=1 Tax=Jaapia argillacea MUCL 33604 TaxID=933084 RepID=A0A067QN82_9AGAM|nr:hypothetical protein JAAARDRAFT_118719 [Jaapia argillacea MUCL 33604]
MVAPLGSVQPVFTFSPIESIPDEAEDKPEPGLQGSFGALELPGLVFGAAVFSGFYNSDSHISSDIPVRTVRLALRYGIRTFDTSAYYGPSEIVLGTALKALELEYPRSSYKLITKCGRYGSGPELFDYSPATIRASVQRSLSRLHTTYLDTVYLHDVEYVATAVAPRRTGNPVSALDDEKAQYGLLEGEEGKVHGEGDQKILDAIAELRKMQEEGLIKTIGITGFPLPTLLRLALLVRNTAPYKPLDVLLSYSHLCLQTSTFIKFAPQFLNRAGVSQVVTASPLSMGLLTPNSPAWHPATELMAKELKEAREKCAQWQGGLVNIALGYAIRLASNAAVPTVVGLSNLREVHENVRLWREAQHAQVDENRKALEDDILKIFADSNFLDWSWASPP